jgi:hypothetical protein
VPRRQPAIARLRLEEPVKKLTLGQIAVLIPTSAVIVGVGAFGVFGTYTNAAAVLHRKGTALGMVAGGEGATLVAALVMIIVTMFGQTTPRIVRAALWLLPGAAAIMGVAIAPTASQMVVFALTPLGMTAAAEGISFLARRIVVHRTDVDIEAQQRNAAIMRSIAYHRARAERHPWKWVRKWSTLKVWRLLRQAGDGDVHLGADLVGVQREQLTEGASVALGEMLGIAADAPAALPPATPSHETCDRSEGDNGDVEATPRDAAETPRVVAAAQQPATVVHQRITPDLEAAIEDALRTVADDPTVRLLTVADVAKQKGVTPGTVRSWVNRGKLAPAQRDSDGRLRFHPNAVAELD